ncbi:type II secretion system protein [Proteiniclasticum sp.]|uniref:type II secretion system protein n=1 Tax=Proteiniclasticum sp. TaxID=2053595 RepID=UPI00289BFE93|nr:type II secretion system protein [Proteiniclasticum sp.]
MTKRNRKRGFSLVELLIVIGITGVLMAMSAPKYQGMVEKAKEMEQRSHVREALNYIDIHNLENTKIAETTVLKEVTGVGNGFIEVLADIEDRYQSMQVSVLRKFADGDSVTSATKLIAG